MPESEKKNSSFVRRLFFLVLILFALIGILSLASEWIPEQRAQNRIGVIDVTGIISGSQHIVNQVKKFRQDKRIRGIVLRIDSPGGSVGPSQEIYDEVLKTRESGKTIYASMGAMAASGGYYIASAAEKIFANPGTLTGSIGVIMAFTNAKGLMEKIGLQPKIIKAGKYKDIGSPARDMTKKERNLLQSVVDDVHQQFIEAIASGRGISIEEVTTIADGRIFTGRQAHALNLVDELGGLQATIDQLSDKVGIIGEPKIVNEKPRLGFLDWVLKATINQPFMNQASIPSLQYTWPLNG
ncbi:MAG: signal peptide peptidase SppA [Nitrospina sp.]|nr:signal peptide peptidase SppA [Nitrospina sp.]